MNKVYALFSFVCFTLLIGCNGISGENTSVETDEDVTTAESTLSLTTLNNDGDEQISFSQESVITVQAKLVNAEGLAIPDTRINFSADLGELSVPSSLTNSEGISTTQISNTDNDLSAGSITASVDTLSKTVDFEFFDSDIKATTNQLTIQLLLNGNETNQFRTDETVQVQVLLVNSNNEPIDNEIINYTTSLGEFGFGNQSALTSDTGLATLTLFPLNNNVSIVGAGIVRASMESDNTINANMNFQVISAESITEQLRIGSFNDANEFVQGEVEFSVTNNEISSGGTTSVSVTLVDSEGENITIPTQVSFTSNCALNDKANIDTTVLSNNGIAQTTFEDINCAGINGTDDLITATVELADGPIIATSTLSIKGEALGSIEFVSAEPENIFLKGSGGQESSTLTFLVKGALGNPLSQQEVSFNLNSQDDGLGITLSREEGLTNSQGLITTQVSSGNTPAVIRVTATASSEDESQTIQTESNSLTANTGLPHQSGFTIAASVLNPEADVRGTESVVSAWLSDSFGNRVADGTTINFTTEGGSIESSCNTLNGHCSVVWTATEPYPSDRRSTILATATGHETFYDTNGNNVFDSADGSALTASTTGTDEDTLKSVYAGFGRQQPLSEGFIDLPEAWRDDNENGDKDPEETAFFDQDSSGVHTSTGDGLFNGPQCDNDSTDCSGLITATLRKSMVIVMSSSNVAYILSSSDETTTYQESDGSTASATAFPTIADDSSLSLKFQFADQFLQTLPVGTDVFVSLIGGDLSGSTSASVGKTTRSGYTSLYFTVTNPAGGDPETATLTISVKTPNTLLTNYVSRAISLL